MRLLLFWCYQVNFLNVLQSQAKLLAEQKRIPFATIDDNINEELGKTHYL